MVELALALTYGTDRREFKLLPGGPPLVVGRGSDATLKVDEPLLSRRHFEVRFDEEHGLELVDLRSANGTYLNGKLIQRTGLRSGDVIRAGDRTFKVEYDGGGVKSAEPRRQTGTWLADAVSGELRCQQCGRLISMTTVGDDQRFEWGEEVLCPSCLEGSSTAVKTDGLGLVEQQLRQEGFEVLQRISSAGTLVPVFKAKRVNGLADVVALKVLPLLKGLSEKKIERFNTEARSMAQINHPNVVHVFDVRHRPELVFIVMEFIEGESLLRKIEKTNGLPLLEGLRVGLAVARALEAAAKQGIVHRNVKPGNILIGREDGTPKLVDFGLAKGVKSFGPGVTEDDETLGTIRYMPPEQVKDARVADCRSDTYSLAATIFQSLTGLLPYPNHSELELLRHVVSGSLPDFIIPPTDKLPSPIAAVLQQAVKSRPDQRPATATRFREALATAIASLSGGRALLSTEDLAALK
ncbi:MAG: protein kinase [Planctomycetota bacterium]